MEKKVCMFVWNHFTNDARVFRECTALIEAGFEVDLIAVHDWKDNDLQKREQRNEGFNIIRVNNRLRLLSLIAGPAERLRRLLSRNIITKLITLGIVLLGLWSVPLITLSLLLLMILIAPHKMRTVYLRTYIAFQMIRVGVSGKYDIYHSNDLNTLPQGFICARVLRKRKLIYDSHEVQTSRTGYNSKIYGIAEKFFIKHIDIMIMENHTRAKYIEDLYGFYPKVVHNYPIPMQPETSKKIDLYSILDIPRDEPILLYQGGIQIGRGLDKLIQATPMFERGVVVLIGDGRIKPELEKMVRDMGLENRVKFLPKVPLEDLLDYTRNAYLGFQILNNVCFNHYSASSNKLFEYIMSAVPVVACSFPEIQRVVDKENIGVCVNSHDPKSIACGVNHLLNNDDLIEIIKENCMRARDRYNWTNESNVFIKIYNGLEM
ncbi:glycosyltransferase [Paenibacillus sp. GCM10027629]|uniref:glycosyltransferase n=1 Tax=Paenibacillus sp. GCM10027629 TaxID=3273414 RepID=UPI00363ADC1A